MDKVLYFAQKGLILDKTRTKLLVIKYINAKYLPESLNNRYGLPGGKMDFGESIDKSFIREVKEETGITIIPDKPFDTFSWIYQKDNGKVQIVALVRIGYYKSGKILKVKRKEKESSIENVQWLNLDKIDLNEFIKDEAAIVKRFLSRRLD